MVLLASTITGAEPTVIPPMDLQDKLSLILDEIDDTESDQLLPFIHLFVENRRF